MDIKGKHLRLKYQTHFAGSAGRHKEGFLFVIFIDWDCDAGSAKTRLMQKDKRVGELNNEIRESYVIINRTEEKKIS